MKQTWKSRELSAQVGVPYQGAPGFGELAVRFLYARNIRSEEEFEFLVRPRLSSLADPFLMQDMSAAVERLVKAQRLREKVCVYADFDLDGTSGLALALTALRKMGFAEVLPYQPKRLSEGYGFHEAAVQDLSDQGVTVIVTVDVGITSFKACEKARELGVDVVLTDHHLPMPELPSAFCVVNPNRGDCPSGLGYLCGAGVAFYLVRALKRRLVDAGLIQDSALDLKDLLDFVTIATVTDMVPLVKDNRALVKSGLKQIAHTEKAGLKALLEELKLWGLPMTSQDLAIRFAPKLNALSRMETGLRAIDLFLEEDHERARQYVHDVLDHNAQRVELQSAGEKKALDLLENWSRSGFVFCSDIEFHRGVVGLIATKLAQETGKAAFVGSLSCDGLIVGSARVPPGSDVHLVEALQSASEALNRFGGHASAAGFELRLENVQNFIDFLDHHFNQEVAAAKERVVEYDLDLSVTEVTKNLLEDLDHLGPYGQGFPTPLFRLRAIVSESRVLQGGHLKFRLKDELGSRDSGLLDAIFFSPPARISQQSHLTGQKVEILAEPQWNDYMGRRRIQLLVKEMNVRGA